MCVGTYSDTLIATVKWKMLMCVYVRAWMHVWLCSCVHE